MLDLKRRAVALKREGNLAEAKELLAQARDLELADFDVADLEDPLLLKKLALSYKRRGLMNEAKNALSKAKAIEAQLAQEVQVAAHEQAKEEAKEVAKDIKVSAGNPTPDIIKKEIHQYEAQVGNSDTRNVPKDNAPADTIQVQSPVTPDSGPPPPIPLRPISGTPSMPPPTYTQATRAPPNPVMGADPTQTQKEPVQARPPPLPLNRPVPSPVQQVSPSSQGQQNPINQGVHKSLPAISPQPLSDVRSPRPVPTDSVLPSQVQQPKQEQHSTEEDANDDLADDVASESSDLRREYEALLGGGGGAHDEDDDDDAIASDADGDESEFAAEYQHLLSGGHDDAGSDVNDDMDNGGTHEGPTEMTDEELLDVDSMADLLEIGEPLPSKEIYDARILANKQQALALKRAGDIPGAKEALRLAKQLEAALQKVQVLASHGPTALDEEDEDAIALRNLAKGGDSDDGGGADNDDLDADSDGGGGMELIQEELNDPDMLAEMIAIGMKVPAPEDLRAKAVALKREALQYKKAGDMEKAKTSLREAKGMESQAQIIEQALRKSSQGDDGDHNDVDIEAILAGDADVDDVLSGLGGSKKKPTAKTSSQEQVNAETLKSVVPKKTAAELKADAIRFKQENKLTEAAQAFRMYKAALAEEEAAQARAAAEEMARMAITEADMADEQTRLFEYYSLLGRQAALGKRQHDAWLIYARACRQAAQALRASPGSIGTPTRSAEPKMYRLTNDLAFVETDADLNDGDLSIAIVCLLQVDQIEGLTSIPVGSTLELECVVGLPPSEEQSEGSMTCSFKPPTLPSPKDTSLSFMQIKKLPIPRGDTKYARMVLRRVPRKRVEFRVLAVPPPPPEDPKAHSFFKFRRASTPPPPEPVVLGKLAIDLKPLLDCNHIVGDFPLIGRGRRASGGILRLALRSGRPFAPDATSNVDSSPKGGARLEPYSPFELS